MPSSPKDSAVYRVCRGLGSGFLNSFSWESFGVENVPKSGPYLIACNHVSFLDPVAVGCFIPHDIRFIARETLFKKPFFKWLGESLNVVKIDNTGASATSMKSVVRALRGSDPVFIFLEGTRSRTGELQDAKKGIGMLACLSKVPIIPTRIFGGYEIWQPGQKFPDAGCAIELSVVFGKPLLPDEYDPGKQAKKERYQLAADNIMANIASLNVPNVPIT